MPSPPSPLPPIPLSAKDRNKNKSRARRDKKRDQARAASSNPTLKMVHRRCISEAQTSALELGLDATALPHSKPAWLGSRSAAEDPLGYTEPTTPHDLSSGLGGVSYTQRQVDALSGTEGFMYVAWLGAYAPPHSHGHNSLLTRTPGSPSRSSTATAASSLF
jgi:hypothetical protein